MHDQIGDSLAESEREVVKVIEQIGALNQRPCAAGTHRAVYQERPGTDRKHPPARRKQQAVIAAIDMQLEAQTEEFRSTWAHSKG